MVGAPGLPLVIEVDTILTEVNWLRIQASGDRCVDELGRRSRRTKNVKSRIMLPHRTWMCILVADHHLVWCVVLVYDHS